MPSSASPAKRRKKKPAGTAADSRLGPSEKRMTPSGRNTAPLAAIVFGVLIVDQLSKHAIRSHYAFGQSRPVLPGVLHLTYHRNTGAAFGIFDGQNIALLGLSLLFILAMAVYLWRNGAGSFGAAFALILAGAIGNAVDRLRFGYVVDFIDMRVWPIFNMADSAITCGVFLVFFGVLRRRGKGR